MVINSTAVDSGKSLVKIQAVDALSAISSVRYSFDRRAYFLYTAPFTVSGEATLFAFADDAVGNRSTEVTYHVPPEQTVDRIFLPIVQK